MAGAGPDASWSSADVSYPAGVLHLRYARHFFVGAGVGCETVPSADRLKWRCVPPGSAGVLGHRLQCGNAALVDDRRLYRLWPFRCSTAVVQFEQLASQVMKAMRNGVAIGANSCAEAFIYKPLS